MATDVRDRPPLRLVVAWNLRRFRKARGWSQERLARETALSRETIRLIERGDRSVYIETLERIAEALDEDISALTSRASSNREPQDQAA